MKTNILKSLAVLAVGVFALSSCDKFLDRPAEDSFTTGDYYKTDAQVIAGTNYLYSSPWYDIIRFYIYDSEAMCGNVFLANNAYHNLAVNGTDGDLKNMSYSLWAVNAQCNTVINNILAADGNATEAVKNQCIGECLAWKAMTYFFLVRTFGDVPIVHDNTSIIKENTYNTMQKVQKADVYEYIIMTLEKALELLPKNAYIGKNNRIDYYAAEGLLAKVYLAKAGVSGTLNNDDLQKAVTYAKDVIENSGRKLTPKYSDIFRLEPTVYQQTGENLFSWQWTATSGIWTCQNSIQCDVGLTGFSGLGDLWGDWTAPSVDLADAFGVSATDCPTARASEKDTRRKATMMMFGDKYEYFWQDKGGFDFYRFFYDKEYAASNGSFGAATGANYCKHLFGNEYDHELATGVSPSNMTNQLPTHILRLADIYLVAAEALVLTGGDALPYINAVRERAGVDALTSVTFEDVWKERRLELALEGDRWYDFVRRSYYDLQGCIDELYAQRRSYWDGLNDNYEAYVCDEQGNYVGPGASEWGSTGVEMTYNNSQELSAGSVKASIFSLPFPTEDEVQNPNMATSAPAIHVDVRSEYKYNF